MPAILTGPDGEEKPNLNLEKTSKQNFEPPHFSVARRPKHKMLSQWYPNANCTADNCFVLEDKRTERGGGRSHDAEIRYTERSRKKWKGLEKGMGRQDAWRHKFIMSQDEVDMAQ
jgi:hypothetical protein